MRRLRLTRSARWRDRREPLEPREPSGPVRAAPIPPQLSVYPADALASRVLSGDQRTARWVGPMFAIFALILVAWIVILAVTLPERGILHNEDLVWVGFDFGLLLGLTWTAWAALRRKRSLPLAAAATGASLITDAWFDVIGSDGHDRLAAFAMALLVELPLSAFCWWLAMHSQELAARRVSRMILWWRQVEGVTQDMPSVPMTGSTVVPTGEATEDSCEPEPPLAQSH